MSAITRSASVLGTALALCAAALPAAAQTPAAASPILTVNVDRVYQESAAGKGALASLRPQAEQLQTRVRTLQEQFQREEQSLAGQRPQGAAATPAAQQAFETKVRDYQQRSQTANTELNTRQRTLQATQASVLQQMNEAMNPIVSQIMRERGAQVAMPTGATLAVSTSADITGEVITRLDRALPRVNLTAPAAGTTPAATAPRAPAPAAPRRR